MKKGCLWIGLLAVLLYMIPVGVIALPLKSIIGEDGAFSLATVVYIVLLVVRYLMIKKYCNSNEFASLKSSCRQDVDLYNSAMEELKKLYEYIMEHAKERTHWCSTSNTYNNVKENVHQYVCKFFDIDICEDTINELNTLHDAYNRIPSLLKTTKELHKSVKTIIKNEKIPLIIKTWLGMYSALGMVASIYIQSELPYKKYSFKYKELTYTLTLDVIEIERFVSYIRKKADCGTFAKKQRAQMTPELRKKIMMRDDYTCVRCGASRNEEPNLLLEVDHIIPIARGGKTVIDNLQTLCWKCNRAKSDSIE